MSRYEQKGNFSKSLLDSCPAALSCHPMPSGAHTLWKRFKTLAYVMLNYLKDLNIHLVPLRDVPIF